MMGSARAAAARGSRRRPSRTAAARHAMLPLHPAPLDADPRREQRRRVPPGAQQRAQHAAHAVVVELTQLRGEVERCGDGEPPQEAGGECRPLCVGHRRELRAAAPVADVADDDAGKT